MRVLLLLLSLLVLPSLAEAACSGSSPTWTAASVNRLDVLDCFTAASNGDTVNIPAGTATDWTTAVTLSKAITVAGAGGGATIIQDNVSSGALFSPTLVANQTTRVTGMKFVAGSRSSAADSGIIIFDGGTNTVDSRRFRFDHNEVDHLLGVPVRVARAYGVIDHNTIVQASPRIHIYVQVTTSYDWPDAQWVRPVNFGGDDFVFIEDNVLTYDTGSTFAVVDSFGGARFVFRHNTVTRGYVEMHGTESSGRPRGAAVVEVYENAFDNTGGTGGGTTFVGVRSGTVAVHDNNAENWTQITNAANLTNQRMDNDFATFTIADGRNVWDSNDDGNNPYTTGTASGVNNGAGILTDSGKSFTTNQYRGFVLRKTNAPCNVPITAVNTSNEQFTVTGHGFSTGNSVYVQSHVGSTPHVQGHYTATVVDANTITLGGVNVTSAGSGGWISLSTGGAPCSAPIISNTSTTITYGTGGGFGAMSWSVSDTYEINKILAVFDQPGTGGGTTLNGVTNAVPGTYDQAIRPAYEWNNTKGGVTDLDFSVANQYSGSIIENTHYFNDTTPEGYTTYTYPHPLVGGEAATVSLRAPGGLRISGGARMP